MNKPMADLDLLTLVNSGGEPVVDALLYLVPHSGLSVQHILLWTLTDVSKDSNTKMLSISNALNA
jgi:hypothetical protein